MLKNSQFLTQVQVVVVVVERRIPTTYLPTWNVPTYVGSEGDPVAMHGGDVAVVARVVHGMYVTVAKQHVASTGERERKRERRGR